MSSSFRRVSASPVNKTASVKLPNDPRLWVDEIYRYIGRMHPYLVPYLQGDVDWSVEPINDIEGNGTGYVTALLGETPLQIPIVVRDFELKPIDLYLTPEGEMKVLDKDVAFDYPVGGNVDVGQPINPYQQPNANGMSMAMGKMAARARTFATKLATSLPDLRATAQRQANALRTEFPAVAERLDKMAAECEPTSAFDALSAYANLDGTLTFSGFANGERTVTTTLTRGQAFANPQSKLASLARVAYRDADGAFLVNTPGTKLAEAMPAAGSSNPGPVSAPKPGSSYRVHSEGEDVSGTAYASATLSHPYQAHSEGQPVLFLAKDGRNIFPLRGDVRPSSSGASLDGKAITALAPGARGFLAVTAERPEPALIGPLTFVKEVVGIDGSIRYRFIAPGNSVVHVTTSKIARRIIQVEGQSYSDSVEFVIPAGIKFVPAGRTLVLSKFPTEMAKAAGREYTMAPCETGIVVDGRAPMHAAEVWALLASTGATTESVTECVKQASYTRTRVTAPAPDEKTALFVPAPSDVDHLMAVWAAQRPAVNRLANALAILEKEAADKGINVTVNTGEGEKKEDKKPEGEAGGDASAADVPGDPAAAAADPAAAGDPAAADPAAAPVDPNAPVDPATGAPVDPAMMAPPPTPQETAMAAAQEGMASAPPVADSLSAVNLLSPQNAGRFAEGVDDLESANKVVADLLFRVRRGDVQGVEEGTVRDALFALKSIGGAVEQLGGNPETPVDSSTPK